MIGKVVALAKFLSSCPEVTTLGVRPCMGDYSDEERNLIRNAKKVYFPTMRFVDILEAAGIPTFPSPTTYRYQRSRVLQALLFQCLELPRPRTRICFGKRQKHEILSTFEIPFIAMAPSVLPHSAHLVDSFSSFESYSGNHNPIIFREHVKWSERISLICVNFQCIGAIQTISKGTEGGVIRPLFLDEDRLGDILQHTNELVRSAGIEDITVEWGRSDSGWLLIEMSRPPFRFPTPAGIICRHDYIKELIKSEAL